MEGLSVGAQLAFGVSGWTGDLRGHLGWADRRPNINLRIARRSASGTLVVAAGAGLRGVQPYENPLGIGNTLTAVLLGQDRGEYVREEALRFGFREAIGRWYVGLVAARERTVSSRAPWGLFELDDSGGLARPVQAALATDGVGLEAWWVLEAGLDRFRPRTRVRGDAAVRGGSHGFGSATVRAATVVPLLRSRRRLARSAWSLHLETEIGVVSAGAPGQRLRSLGGAWTVRGWDPGSVRGTRWLLNRTTIEWHGPLGDLGAFHDVGTVNRPSPTPSGSFKTAAHSVGLGLGVVDGFVRFDVAWPVEGGTTRLDATRFEVAVTRSR